MGSADFRGMERRIQFELGHTVGHHTDGRRGSFEYAPILFVRPQGDPHSLVALNRADWQELGRPESIIVTVQEIFEVDE